MRASIGAVTLVPEPLNQEKPAGVTFSLPYGEVQYAVTLSNPEMDELLKKGFEKLLGNCALSGFDSNIELPQSELPLFVGVRSIASEANPGRFHDIDMGVSIVTHSIVYEHRGILLANRRGADGTWSFVNYEAQPPLKHRP